MTGELTQEQMEDGEARATLHRLVSTLAKARSVPFNRVYTNLMMTRAWQQAGNPDPKTINASQVSILVPLLERQIEKARAGQVTTRHIVSKAPPAPWAQGAGQGERGGGNGRVTP